MNGEARTASPGGEVVVYEAPDGEVHVDVRLDWDTVWLTQQQMAELFGRDRSVVTQHIRNAFREGELDPEATSAKSAQVQSEDRPSRYVYKRQRQSFSHRKPIPLDPLCPEERFVHFDLPLERALQQGHFIYALTYQPQEPIDRVPV